MKKLILIAVYTLIALSLFSQGDLSQEEQDLLNKVNAENASSAATAESQEAYNNGIALFGKREYKKAIASFSKAISGDPKFEAAYYNKGVAQNQAKLYKSAITTFSNLIQINDANANAYSQRALAYQKKNQLKKAVSDYGQAQYFDGKNEKHFYNGGGVLFMLGEYDKAIKSLTKAIELKSDFYAAYNDRGSCYRMKKNYKQALVDYQQAGKYGPKHAFVFNNIGTVKNN